MLCHFLKVLLDPMYGSGNPLAELICRNLYLHKYIRIIRYVLSNSAGSLRRKFQPWKSARKGNANLTNDEESTSFISRDALSVWTGPHQLVQGGHTR